MCDVLEALFCNLSGRLVDHLALVDSFLYFLPQDMDHNIDV